MPSLPDAGTRAGRWPAGELGEVSVSPLGPAVVGEYGTWTFRYVTGPYGVDDGGGLLFLFPLPTDRGRPQFTDPSGPNYCTASTTGIATVTLRFEKKLYERPWPAGIAVDVTDGPLAPGDVVELVVGDRSAGSPGARSQSYVEDASRVRVMIDPFATGRCYDVPGVVEHPVVAGPAGRLVTIADSETTDGADIGLTVRAIDRYGNVASTYAGKISVLHEGVPVASHQFSPSDAGILTTRVPASGVGVHRFTVTETDSDRPLSAQSNPVVVTAGRPPQSLLWGDTQGQTGESVGTGTLQSFFDYARDAARLDFVTHSANDFQVENDFYAEVWDTVDKYNTDGKFVAFGGFEWSGNTPTGGDHNVIYADRGDAPLMRSSHALINDLHDVDTDRRTVTELNRTLRDKGINGICVAHVGGRVADVDLIEPDTTPVLEIVSVHGWFEWLGLEALQRGLEVGFVGASDDHSGRPGASFPTSPAFGVRSGLAAVRAREFTRTGIMDALRARHCYATTGERIYLDVTCGDYTMGDKWTSDTAPQVDVFVAGTAGVESIDLMGAYGALQTWRPAQPESARRLRVAWRGARHRYRGRTQSWDGQLTVTGANILAAESWCFDHPDQGITEQTASRVEWSSSTNGDSDGIVLEFDGEPSSICFISGEIQYDIDLAEVAEGGLEIPVDGGLDRVLSVRRLPEEEPPRQVETSFRPAELATGVNPYFVRVRQSDGHMAWSSPMFVNKPNH